MLKLTSDRCPGRCHSTLSNRKAELLSRQNQIVTSNTVNIDFLCPTLSLRFSHTLHLGFEGGPGYRQVSIQFAVSLTPGNFKADCHDSAGP